MTGNIGQPRLLPEMAGLRHTRVSRLMTRDVVCVHPETSFDEIACILTQHRYRAVPVVDHHGNLQGVVTESDLMDVLEGQGAREPDTYPQHSPSIVEHRQTAAELMSLPPITIRPESGIADAARIMRKHEIGWLPVVSGAKEGEPELVGVLSRGDLLRGFERDDVELRTEIEDVLIRRLLALNPERLHVSVHAGVVGFSGEVETRRQAVTLRELAQRLEGVVTVNDHLTWLIED